MIKVIYNPIPMGFKEQHRKILENKDGLCIAVVSDSLIIKSFLFNLLKVLQRYDISICLKSDDVEILKYAKDLHKDDTRIYQMKSSGILYFRLGEMHSNISNVKSMDCFIDRWGYLNHFEIVVHSKKHSLVENYFQKNLYGKDTTLILDYIENFEFIIRESGDEDEAEIILKKQHFDLLNSEILKAVKEAIQL